MDPATTFFLLVVVPIYKIYTDRQNKYESNRRLLWLGVMIFIVNMTATLAPLIFDPGKRSWIDILFPYGVKADTPVRSLPPVPKEKVKVKTVKQPVEVQQSLTVKRRAGIRLREQPSTNSTILVTFLGGETVEAGKFQQLNARDYDGDRQVWRQVKYREHQGWILNKLLD